MPAGFEQLLFGAHPHGPPEAKFDRELVRLDREHAGQDKEDHEPGEKKANDLEAAAEGFGKRLGAGVVDSRGGGRHRSPVPRRGFGVIVMGMIVPMIMVVIMVRMIVLVRMRLTLGRAGSFGLLAHRVNPV